jgi:hypothetical protein
MQTNNNNFRVLKSLVSVLIILLSTFSIACYCRWFCDGLCKQIITDYNYIIPLLFVSLLIIAASTQHCAINRLVELGICSSQYNIPLLFLFLFFLSGMPRAGNNLVPSELEPRHNFTSVLQFQVAFILISYFFIEFKIIAISIQIYIIIQYYKKSKKIKID